MLHEQCVDGVPFLTSDKLGTKHGFSTRLGGVSQGIYATLNLRVNCDDAPEHILENYRRLFHALDLPEKAVFSHQVHGKVVRKASQADVHTLMTDVPYEADGLITDVPDLPLIIFTADCVPILLHDGVRGAVGAVHAGWRGTALDIAGEAVRRMREEYGCKPENIHAAIGPCIGPCCFETGPEVPDAMEALLGADAQSFVAPHGTKYMVDLKGINRHLLERAGLQAAHIDVSPLCTMCNHDRFWSHRYTKGQRGTQGSLIMLEARRPCK